MVVNSEREEEARQEIKVEQGRKRVKKKGKTQKSKKKGVIGIEACINRLPISLPLNRLIL